MRLSIAAALLLILTLPCVASAQVTVQDALGRTVELRGPPERVVSLSPSTTEFLAYLGVLDRVVGADSQSLASAWYMNASRLLVEKGAVDLGGYWWSAIAVEKILELNPDLVIADRGAHLPLLSVLIGNNLTVVYLNGGSSSSANDVLEDLSVLATIFGKGDAPREFADELQEAFLSARASLPAGEPSRVLVVVGVYNGIWVAGRGTFIDDVMARLGLVNAADVYSWSAVSIERVLAWSPDVVLVTPMGIDERVLEESGLKLLGDRLRVLNQTEADILLRPGPLLLYAPSVLAKYVGESWHQVASVTQQEQQIGPSALWIGEAAALIALGALIGFAAGRYVRK